MPLNTQVNARTHEANKFATYTSSGPGGAGSKLTINMNNNSSTGMPPESSNGGGSGGGARATSNQVKLTRAVIL